MPSGCSLVGFPSAIFVPRTLVNHIWSKYVIKQPRHIMMYPSFLGSLQKVGILWKQRVCDRWNGGNAVWTRTNRTPAFWDTLRRPMITHTSNSHQIACQTRPSQSNKFYKIAKNTNFKILQKLHVTHPLKLLNKMYEYDMDPNKTLGATKRTRDSGRTDGQTDRRSETVYPLTTSLCGEYNQGQKGLFGSDKFCRRNFYIHCIIH